VRVPIHQPFNRLALALAHRGHHTSTYHSSYTRVQIDVSQCLEGLDQKTTTPVVCIDWYNGEYGFVEEHCPALCICFENGRLQIMDAETDPHPVLIDTEMTVAECRWNQRGTVLAIAGTEQTDSGPTNVLQFYSPHGDNLRTLKV
jgi:hypothetical protein